MIVNKKIKYILNKKFYYLGMNYYDEEYWLSSPIWYAGWFWEYGLIRKISKNNYSLEKWNNLFKNNLIHLSPLLKDKVLNEKESWEIGDLMTSYYTLFNSAIIFLYGNSLVSATSLNLKNKKLADEINKIILPKIFKRTEELLIPKKLKK